MCVFQAEDIRTSIDKIEESVTEIKKLYSTILSAPTSDQSKCLQRESSTEQRSSLLHLSIDKHGDRSTVPEHGLKTYEKEIISSSEDLPCCPSQHFTVAAPSLTKLVSVAVNDHISFFQKHKMMSKLSPTRSRRRPTMQEIN